MKKNQIDFRFAKNWRAFLRWYNQYCKTAKIAPMWSVQEKKIESCFEPDNPGIVSWSQLWKDFSAWYKSVARIKSTVKWSEMQRQIETLMLSQLSELNKEQYILVFLHQGKPEVDSQKMTYWDALRTKESLMGDSNGHGGNENVDKVTIININKLIQ